MVGDPFKPFGAAKDKSERKPKPQEDWVQLTPIPLNAPKPPTAHPKRGVPARSWSYLSPSGELLGLVCRFENDDGSKDILPLSFYEGRSSKRREWRWKGFSEPRPLYGLDRLAACPEAPVVVTEGEKAADAAQGLLPGWVAVTSPNGSKSAAKASWLPLHKRDVVIWPDADKPGTDYALTVARLLQGVASSVRIARAPAGIDEGWDAADALFDAWTAEQTQALLDAAQPVSEFMRGMHGFDSRAEPDDKPHEDKAESEGDGKKKRGPTQATFLLSLIGDSEFWHDEDTNAFVSAPVNGHFENWAVNSRQFRIWLCGQFFNATGGAISTQALQEVMRVIEARAIFDGRQYKTCLRVGERAGEVFIDLGSESWQAVRVTGNDGWSIIDRAPVKFIRSNSMRPLPFPEAGETVEKLRDLVNVRSEGDFRLVVAWMLGALRPSGPYPILIINGEQGSSKSTLAKLVRQLTDPSSAMTGSTPKDEGDLFVSAVNSWVSSYDNLSSVPAWLSDSFCRLATGGSIRKRRLQTDMDEVILPAMRPLVLNGIPDLAGRPDLASRAILLSLPAIPSDQRKTEREFDNLMDKNLPYVFGALLDGISGALRNKGRITLPNRSRMADFEEWVVAAESSLGWAEGAFLEAYDANREGANEATLEADPLAGAIRDFIASDQFVNPWQGTASNLLDLLGVHVSDGLKRSRIWPAVNKLKDRLRRLQPSFRNSGVLFDLDLRSSDHERSRLICIRST